MLVPPGPVSPLGFPWAAAEPRVLRRKGSPSGRWGGSSATLPAAPPAFRSHHPGQRRRRGGCERGGRRRQRRWGKAAAGGRQSRSAWRWSWGGRGGSNNEWKTRYETQVELNKQLERQINILRDKVELIRRNPADKLFIVRTFDKMPVGSLKEVLKHLEEEKRSLQNQLKDYELRLEQEAKAYHKANDERRMYLSEILQISAKLKIVERQKPDALTGKGEKQILRGRHSVPGNPKMVNPQNRSIKKTVGVNQLPQLKR
ncbi:coiled-coil domain-containing protein 169-like isoform X1 [Corvus kubaryi]|uniref:coiled-coil domain-containing protein 169-like isoform X1 n=1 Tax=Corvus kubaryi TaxID=68294 RepID=UPI001C03EAC4|nr:coiled-coil domain-containing protein 169-like isoform X1 [Corvus kubaryi]